MMELLIQGGNMEVAVYRSTYAHEPKAGHRWAGKCVLTVPEVWIDI